jgi:hypothetical protein
MDVTLNVNGLDLHDKLSTYRVSQEVTYRQVLTTLDGTEHAFGEKIRPIVTFSLLPLTDEESTALYRALSDLIFPVSFTNQHTGVNQTRELRLVSNLESAFALRSVDGKRRYRGTEIQLRGR